MVLYSRILRTLETSFETLLFKGIQDDNPNEISIDNLSKCLQENDKKKIRNIVKINISNRIAKKILLLLAEEEDIRYITLFPDEPGFFQGIGPDSVINLPGNIFPKEKI